MVSFLVRTSLMKFEWSGKTTDNWFSNFSDEEYQKMDQKADENRQRKQSMNNLGNEDELLDFFSLLK